MKYSLMFLACLVSLFASCSSATKIDRRNIEVAIKSDSFYKFEYEKINNKTLKNRIHIVFEADFQGDNIELYKGDAKILNEKITTDERIGVAHSVDIDLNKNEEVFLKYNAYPKVKIDLIHYYTDIYISKPLDSKKIVLHFSDSLRFYK